MFRARFVAPILALLLVATPAFAQYVFLDANGDGVNDNSDQLNTTGTTDLDVWFVTDQNKDGSPAACTTDPTEPLTINSYEIVLRALNGKVRFGPMRNRVEFTGTPVCFAGYEDTTSTSVYHNGWGYRDILPPGRYLVATLTVEILEGEPSLSFAGRSPLQPVDLTSFGTKCTGTDYDNTYVLGEEFFESAGIGRPTAEAGGPYYGVAGRDIQFDGRRSIDPDGEPLSYAWSFDDGGTAAGAVVQHAFADVGAHTVTLTISNGSGSDDDQADVTVVAPYQPVANAGGPYSGRPGAPIRFDGSASFDPDNDPLSYRWEFGDGGVAGGEYPAYIYAAAGTFTVRLTVSDMDFSSTDETTATIATPVNNAPVANAGGPYEGIAGRWIQFDATGSIDADGDFLTFLWNFGDNKRGAGRVSAHAYAQPGTYVVDLTVYDGIANGYAQSSATIAAGLAATAFLDGGASDVNVDDPEEFVVVRFQPADGSFTVEDVDPDQVTLQIETLDGSTVAVDPAHAVLQQDDSDHDGFAEFVALFPRARFRDLADEGAVSGSTHFRLVGGLNRGGSYSGAFDATILRANQFALTVTPNPFNPITRIVIHTKSAGSVTAKLYDVHGRRVKTILRGEALPAGRHDLVIEARDDAGAQLASGLYFLQVVTADGARTGRLVVAK
ncbi:MAG TPA: PKD domain-containing protein [Candidatus Eisenbacteria bacterium]|nr:PKD domain-containing protein [Candidatus Eisenbacteria bacterium]